VKKKFHFFFANPKNVCLQSTVSND